MDDADIFADLVFAEDGEGSIRLTWEVASRCTEPRADASPCWSEATKQPNWSCTNCGGLGAEYAPPVEIGALFRGQSRWKAHRMSGEHGLGEAQLTTPVHVKPAYTDERVRDRLTVLDAVGDYEAGRVFYPAAQPIPFLFGSVQHAWRVQLQSMDQATRTRPQP